MEGYFSQSTHTCNYCSKVLPTYGELVEHKKTHVGDRPFSCNICHKRFTQKAHLNIHKRTHTGQLEEDVAHTKLLKWLIFIYILYWSLLYSSILCSWADSLHSHAILHEWIAFYRAFLNVHRSGVLIALAWLVPQESAARESPSWCVLCTPYNHAQCHFMQSHIRKVYACLAVTCHLRFWRNDRGLLRATAVTRGWNGHRNKSQHRKLTLEKKILLLLLQGFEPVTFRSRVRRSNHWAIPAPLVKMAADFVSPRKLISTSANAHTRTHLSVWGECSLC